MGSRDPAPETLNPEGHAGMKYTKEQAEMLALLVVMGCALIVLSFLYLVKPNFVAMAHSRRQVKKTESDIGKLSHAPVSLAKAKQEEAELKEVIQRGETSIFSGTETGSPLSEILVQAATALNLKPAYGEQSNRQLLEFSERAADGSQATRHYDEVFRTMDIRAATFFDFSRFLGALEHANKGVRVSGLKIDSQSLDPESREQGKVNATIEVTLLGFREERAADSEPGPERGAVVASVSPEVFQVGDKRNPFGPPGGMWEPTTDPLLAIREMLKNTKVNGVIAEWLLLDVPARTPGGLATSRSLRLQKGQLFALGQAKMKYVEQAGDRFVFEAIDEGVRFTVETNFRGVVTTLKEEDAK
jgi:hypothetical protein